MIKSNIKIKDKTSNEKIENKKNRKIENSKKQNDKRMFKLKMKMKSSKR